MADSGKPQDDLLSSGKVIAGATMSVVRERSVENVDKGQVADAAGDLLHAGSTYGHLEDKPVGQYIEKAEQYLHKVDSSGAAPAADQGAKKDDAGEKPEAGASKERHPAAEDDKPEGGGVGNVVKMAEGFLDKQGGNDKSEGGGGGGGGFMKLAQGFLK